MHLWRSVKGGPNSTMMWYFLSSSNGGGQEVIMEFMAFSVDADFCGCGLEMGVLLYIIWLSSKRHELEAWPAWKEAIQAMMTSIPERRHISKHLQAYRSRRTLKVHMSMYRGGMGRGLMKGWTLCSCMLLYKWRWKHTRWNTATDRYYSHIWQFCSQAWGLGDHSVM